MCGTTIMLVSDMGLGLSALRAVKGVAQSKRILYLRQRKILRFLFTRSKVLILLSL